MTNQASEDELKKLAILFANRIGSPWGEGATYERGMEIPEDDDVFQPNGRLFSHFDDKDFDEFVKDLKQEIQTLIRTEKLKLLAEVRERVVGEDEVYAKMKDGIRIVGQPEKPRNELRTEQRIELTKLEAELCQTLKESKEK